MDTARIALLSYLWSTGSVRAIVSYKSASWRILRPHGGKVMLEAVPEKSTAKNGNASGTLTRKRLLTC